MRYCIIPAQQADIASAEELAQSLGLSMSLESDPRALENEADLVLIVDADRLSLQKTGRNAPGPITVEFDDGAMRHRRLAGHNEMIGKAVGVSKFPGLRVLDATAGLAKDSFILADLGAAVTLCERHPIVASLIDWGLRRAQAATDDKLRSIAQRMKLYAGDTLNISAQDLQDIEVVYLDPMFPARQKSASVKKEMQIMQMLHESESKAHQQSPIDEEDSVELLHWAKQLEVARVVVKRPAKSPALGLLYPSHCISGKTVRYDVYVNYPLGKQP